MEDPGLGYQFTVKIDGMPLGDWTKCDGLSMEFHVTEYEEGGMNSFIHRIPGRAKYGNIKLTRPLNSKSQAVSAWMTSLMATVKRQTPEITVMDPAGDQVASWNLVGVYPVKWSAPTPDAAGKRSPTKTPNTAHYASIGDPG